MADSWVENEQWPATYYEPPPVVPSDWSGFQTGSQHDPVFQVQRPTQPDDGDWWTHQTLGGQRRRRGSRQERTLVRLQPGESQREGTTGPAHTIELKELERPPRGWVKFREDQIQRMVDMVGDTPFDERAKWETQHMQWYLRHGAQGSVDRGGFARVSDISNPSLRTTRVSRSRTNIEDR